MILHAVSCCFYSPKMSAKQVTHEHDCACLYRMVNVPSGFQLQDVSSVQKHRSMQEIKLPALRQATNRGCHQQQLLQARHPHWSWRFSKHSIAYVLHQRLFDPWELRSIWVEASVVMSRRFKICSKNKVIYNYGIVMAMLQDTLLVLNISILKACGTHCKRQAGRGPLVV